ncbi:MAG TPA: LPS export ABC transporter permease LptG [Halothiobacillaceae bacterium]|nr:LPS export ABC transporter permease LptG [Halothiobacillaceae bacterium]
MQLIDRYLLRTVVLSGLGASVVFLVLIFVFGLLDEASKVDARYRWTHAFLFVTYTAPGYLYEFFPVAVLVGALLGLGALNAHSELTVMRATGLSIMRLARPVLLGGVLLALLGSLMGETIGAKGQVEASSMRAQNMERSVSVGLGSGIWLRNGPLVINAERALVTGVLFSVRLIHLDEQHRPIRIETAERAVSEGGSRWRLENVQQINLSENPQDAIERRHFSERKGQELFDRQVLDIAVLNPRYLNIAQLYEYVSYLEANDLDSSVYATAMYSRLFQPLSVVAMLLLTLPFVFVSQRGGNAGRWLFIGILMGLGYMTANQIVTALTPAFGIPPWMSIAALPLGVIVLAIAVMLQLNPARRKNE